MDFRLALSIPIDPRGLDIIPQDYLAGFNVAFEYNFNSLADERFGENRIRGRLGLNQFLETSRLCHVRLRIAFGRSAAN
jgi:hypothetical protein